MDQYQDLIECPTLNLKNNEQKQEDHVFSDTNVSFKCLKQ